jgi:hypothetical protein
LACEYGAAGAAGGVLNPLQVKMSAGGIVTLPILKTHHKIAIVWTIVPSGSGSDASNTAVALSAQSVLLLPAEGDEAWWYHSSKVIEQLSDASCLYRMA